VSVGVRTRYLHLHAAAELRRERNTVEIVAVRALVERTDVEEHNQQDKQTDGRRQAHKNADDLASAAEVRDVRPHGERQQETEDEAGEVRVVVDPRKQAEHEQSQQDRQQLHHFQARLFQVPPAVNDFDKQAGQQGELWACRTSLQWSHIAVHTPHIGETDTRFQGQSR